MMIDVARGLTYAEEQGVVHRDIKPENMMLDHAGNVKICDLGIAHTIREGPWRNTARGVFGSPHYIAPEQARGQTTDHRADIYSLGASFYRILAGKTLFAGGSARELIIKHINETPTPIAEAEPALPQSLCKVIDKCLAKDLFSRYQSAGKVAEDLGQALQQVHEAKQAKEARERAGRSRKRRKGPRLALKIIVLLAVVASGTLAFFAVQHPEETRQVMDTVVQWISARMESGSGG